jgi:fatty acid desaturase
MTDPAPRISLARAANRAKLSEPVRLYLWPALIAAAALTVAAGASAWAVPGIVLLLGLAGEAVRASVYSETGHFRSLHAAASRWADITRRERV